MATPEYIAFKSCITYFLEDAIQWIQAYERRQAAQIKREYWEYEESKNGNLYSKGVISKAWEKDEEVKKILLKGENLIQELYQNLGIEINYLIVDVSPSKDKNELESFTYSLSLHPYNEGSNSFYSLRIDKKKGEKATINFQNTENIKINKIKNKQNSIFQQTFEEKELQEKVKLAEKYVVTIKNYQEKVLRYFNDRKSIDLFQNSGIYYAKDTFNKNGENPFPSGLFGNLKEILMSLTLTEMHLSVIATRLCRLITDPPDQEIPFYFSDYGYTKDIANKLMKDHQVQIFRGSKEIQEMIRKDNDIFFATGDFSYDELNYYIKTRNKNKITYLNKTYYIPLYYYYEAAKEYGNNPDEINYHRQTDPMIEQYLNRRDQYQIKALNAGLSGASLYHTICELGNFFSQFYFDDTDETVNIHGTRVQINMLSLQHLGNFFSQHMLTGPNAEKYFKSAIDNVDTLLENAGFTKVKSK